MDSGSIFLKVPSDNFFLGLIRKVIVDFAEKAGFDELETAKIEMAVDEACSNVIKHSYKDQNVRFHHPHKDIEIQISIDKNKFSIIILDKGSSFNFNNQVESIPQIEKHLKEMKVKGLGLYIIKNFMDDVSFHKTDEGYNKLIMIKLLKH